MESLLSSKLFAVGEGKDLYSHLNKLNTRETQIQHIQKNNNVPTIVIILTIHFILHIGV